MPKVNRIVADESLRGGGILASASPVSFASGLALSDLDRGLSVAARGIDDVSKVIAEREKKRAFDKDSRWVTEQQTMLKDGIVDFQNNPENYTKETFADDLRAFGQNQVKLSLRNAPSNQAQTALNQVMGSYLSSKYEQASLTSERFQLDKTREGIIEDISVALGTYRNELSVPNSNPLSELNTSINLVKDNIDATFGEIAPKTARRLRAFADAETALGIAEYYPEEAKALIKDSLDLEEDEKRTILNKIGAVQDAFDTRKLIEFRRARDDARSRAIAGKSTAPIPEETYLEAYPTEASALAAKAEDDSFFSAWNKSWELVNKVSGKRSDVMLQTLSELDDKLLEGTAEDRAIYENVRDILDAKIKQQQHDPPGFQLQNDPEIRELAMKLAKTEDPAARQSLQTMLADRMLELQGYPERGDDEGMGPRILSPEEEGRYLHRATGDKRLLNVDLAKRTADFLNAAPAGEFISKMNEVVGPFERPEHQAIVFADLAREGLRQSYQLIWQNRKQWWVDSLITAVQGTKGLKNITPESEQKYKALIQADPKWLNFQASLIGPSQDRISEISGFLDSITSFAMYQAAQAGTDMTTATQRALDLTIGSTMAFTDVNGQPIVFDIDKPDGSKYTQEEADDVGRRLGVSLKWLDVRKVNQDSFLFLDQINPEEMNINRLQKLRDHVTQTGHWITENDGQTMSLYVKDDMGFSLQLRDRLNKPFTINLNDLPSFKYESQLLTPGFYPHWSPITVSEKPKKTYPLVEQENFHYLLGPGTSVQEWAQKSFLGKLIDPPRPLTLFPVHSRSVTNFPTQPPWMQNPQEPGPVPSLNLQLKTKP